MWLIRRIEDADDGQPLYWRKSVGWVGRGEATLFDNASRAVLYLPLGGRWEMVA
jgi:hypothetical protein